MKLICMFAVLVRSMYNDFQFAIFFHNAFYSLQYVASISLLTVQNFKVLDHLFHMEITFSPLSSHLVNKPHLFMYLYVVLVYFYYLFNFDLLIETIQNQQNTNHRLFWGKKNLIITLSLGQPTKIKLKTIFIALNYTQWPESPLSTMSRFLKYQFAHGALCFLARCCMAQTMVILFSQKVCQSFTPLSKFQKILDT